MCAQSVGAIPAPTTTAPGAPAAAPEASCESPPPSMALALPAGGGVLASAHASKPLAGRPQGLQASRGDRPAAASTAALVHSLSSAAPRSRARGGAGSATAVRTCPDARVLRPISSAALRPSPTPPGTQCGRTPNALRAVHGLFSVAVESLGQNRKTEPLKKI